MENEGDELKVGFCNSDLEFFDETKSVMVSSVQG